MTEKQFSIVGKEYISYYCGYAQIISNGTLNFSVWESEEDAQKVCDLLNEQQATIEKLEKENEQLRKDKEQIKEKSTKNEELIQRKLTNVLLAKIYEAQLSLNPNLPYVGQSLKKEMQLLDKKISELCGDVFNE